MPNVHVLTANGAWNLYDQGAPLAVLRYALVDALGRTVRSVAVAGGTRERINWPEAPGWYTLRVETTDGRLLHVRALRP